MQHNGPIVVIEDDEDDQYILQKIFRELDYGHEIVFCSDGESALDYLNKVEVTPFLILSDINMPKISGFELREMVHTNEKLSIKCIPYLFFTTSASRQSVVDAYALSIQGFFVKPNGYEKLKENIKVIVEYWKMCHAPGSYD